MFRPTAILPIALCLFLTCLCACINRSPIRGNTPENQETVVLKDSTFRTTVPLEKINGGNFIPLYGKTGDSVNISPFEMDKYPVTKEEYLEFVRHFPQWRKSRVKTIFADNNYLKDWKNDTLISGNEPMNAPITNVSWYAANAYCECQGKRLPTVDEWEFVAMASTEKYDARKDSAYNQQILDWYEKPRTWTQPVGSGYQNVYGISDLHGLVWEWTMDFNSVLLSGESRNDVVTDNNLFCGSGSLSATDLMNYAAFMRYAFRGSLKASYSVRNLGFRCVKDPQPQPQ